MEGEVGAQVAPPIRLHCPLTGRFHEVPPLARKRDLSWQNSSSDHDKQQGQQSSVGSEYANPNSNWSPQMWKWDSVMFVAKPSSDGLDAEIGLGAPRPAATPSEGQKKKGAENSNALGKGLGQDGKNLALELGGGPYLAHDEPAVTVRPTKRVRSGSPGNGGSCPVCQVDDCKADLSKAKDYHRRHKVCEVHSKITHASVGKQMQRFCQQCSRFHLLSEFDEGKRSCRRRLAGHNRRRRKIQPEDAPSRPSLAGSQQNNGSGNLEIANLLSMLARLRGNSMDKPTNGSTLPNKDQLIELISKINSTSTGASVAKLPVPSRFDLNVSQDHESSEHHSYENDSSSASSTLDLLGVLSDALKTSNPNNVTTQGSSDSSSGDKAQIKYSDPSTDVSSHAKATISPAGLGKSNCTFRAMSEAVENPVQEARPILPLQLFSSPEDDCIPKRRSSRNLYSEGSNPMEYGSPSSSPPIMQRLFPLHSEAESLKQERPSISRGEAAIVDASTSQGWNSSLHLSMDPEGRRDDNSVVQKLPNQEVQTSSSSGSDCSPSSSNSDTQDRTGRIIFKLFNKDPSSIPGTLKTQILNWLSNSPLEMESYIRPGCVVLSVYLSMPFMAWKELQEDLLHKVQLLQHADSDFWRSGSFLIHTDRKLASYKDGKVHLCKSKETHRTPELMSVSPLAVVSGKETPLSLRGRNLTLPGTKFHCTYMGGYTSKEVPCSDSSGTTSNPSLESFNFPGGPPNVFGRCFIEVEKGFRGNSFPVIIADDSICQELKDLESEFEERSATVSLQDQGHVHGKSMSRETILHFLNELGWLFQRRNYVHSSFFLKDFSSTRFKFLLKFAVERDWSALVKKLLDILVERSSGRDKLIHESLEALSEIRLLNQAVKRKCRKMVDLLLHYSVDNVSDTSKIFLFPPNLAGPGGITPLHLAASMQESEDIVDALTNDLHEVGLNCWDSILDDNGQSPFAYASMRNNHSYNRLVARKLSDRKNGQVSITLENEGITSSDSKTAGQPDRLNNGSLVMRSCTHCVALESRRLRGKVYTKGLLYRPFAHSLLAIAAVCVCVCLFLRGRPELGWVAPFKWENVEAGTR